MNGRIAAFVLLGSLATGPQSFAQDAATNPAATFRSEAQLVLTSFHVIAKKQYVTGLAVTDFRLLADGRTIPIYLRYHQMKEPLGTDIPMNIVIELPDEKVAAWKAEADAHGLTIERWLQDVADKQLSTANGKGGDVPVWEAILNNMKDVPREDFERLPRDGASEHDHYLYGHPRRNP